MPQGLQDRSYRPFYVGVYIQEDITTLVCGTLHCVCISTSSIESSLARGRPSDHMYMYVCAHIRLQVAAVPPSKKCDTPIHYSGAGIT